MKIKHYFFVGVVAIDVAILFGGYSDLVLLFLSVSIIFWSRWFFKNRHQGVSDCRMLYILNIYATILSTYSLMFMIEFLNKEDCVIDCVADVIQLLLVTYLFLKGYYFLMKKITKPQKILQAGCDNFDQYFITEEAKGCGNYAIVVVGFVLVIRIGIFLDILKITWFLQ